MTFDLHPIFVHFPIALLVLYSVLKIIPFKKWFPKVAWKDIELVFLVVGLGGAFFALLSGDNAREMNRPNHDLVEWHETFANLATWLYALLFAGEVVTFLNTRFSMVMGQGRSVFSGFLKAIEKILTHGIFSKIIALIALISITLTGLLGGVMVYGVSADPLAGFVVKILGISL